ncbi:MAG TPA: hypothetical protein DIT84_03975, partial [Clostridiales bacterium]|nr:hypothetical protein [Clostridiales bacterium]
MKKFVAVCLSVLLLVGCGKTEPSAEEKLEHIKSSGDYPEVLIETAEKCPQTIDFVYAYPEKHGKRFDIDLTADARLDTVPLFIQWDERWGYEPYGSGYIGTSG